MASIVCLVHYHEIGLKGNNRSVFEHRLVDNLRAALGGLPVSSVERISMASIVCLVHYHEIGLKGNNRSVFEHRLVDNLRAALGGLPVSSVERISGHILVRLSAKVRREDALPVFDRVRLTPGVARVSLAQCCELDAGQYCAAAYEELMASGPFETFKVQARRSNTTYPLHSIDINQEVGSYLCDRLPDKSVRMKGQDRTVHVYMIQGSAYVYVTTEEGVGGLPVGSAGKVISLLSSGIDSPVASWRMLRRGAVVIGLHFSGRPQTADTSEWLVQDMVISLLSSGIDSPVASWRMLRRGAVVIGLHFSGRPQTADTSEWLVQDIIEKLSPAGGVGRLYVVPFGDIQRRIAKAVPDDLRIIMYRRMMFSFACRLAEIEHAKALVTGESLGQVASQTLENIMARTSWPSTRCRRCPCSGRSSAATSARSWPTPNGSAPLRSATRRRPIAARCSCRAVPRLT